MSIFLRMSSQPLVKIKNDVELFELQQDIQPSFSEGENLDSNKVTKDGMPPLPGRDDGDLSVKENEVRLQSHIHEES